MFDTVDSGSDTATHGDAHKRTHARSETSASTPPGPGTMCACHLTVPRAARPQHCPGSRELDDLELLLSGAYAPLRGFNEPGSVVTLDLPGELSGRAAELTDPEGLPLAVLAPDGTVSALNPEDYGPFRRLHLTPEEAAAQHPGRTVVPVTEPLTVDQLEELREIGPLLLLALSGTGSSSSPPSA